MQEARRVFNQHPRLTILCRDQDSLDVARREFTAQGQLCPDMMAFVLGSLERPCPATQEVVWLSRTDAESAGRGGTVSPTMMPVDWLQEPASPLMTTHSKLRDLVWQDESPTDGTLLDVFDKLAQERLLRGSRLLSQGRVVVTDRLHGHILSALLGLPHILVENNYGKIRRFYEAWTMSLPLTH